MLFSDRKDPLSFVKFHAEARSQFNHGDEDKRAVSISEQPPWPQPAAAASQDRHEQILVPKLSVVWEPRLPPVADPIRDAICLPARVPRESSLAGELQGHSRRRQLYTMFSVSSPAVGPEGEQESGGGRWKRAGYCVEGGLSQRRGGGWEIGGGGYSQEIEDQGYYEESSAVG